MGSLLSSPGRVIKRDQVQGRSVATPAATASEADCDAPVVRVLRSDAGVRVVRIECPCGRTLELDCVLEETSAAARPETP